MNRTPTLLSLLPLTLLIGIAVVRGAEPPPKPMSYQGYLTDGGNPASGIHDLEFRLFTSATGGLQVGNPLVVEDVAVANGLFTVQLADLAAILRNPSLGACFLQLGVRPGSSTGSYTPLAPRQSLGAAPQAYHALNAEQLAGMSAGSFATSTHTHAAGDITGAGAGSGLDADMLDGLSWHEHPLLRGLNLTEWAAPMPVSGGFPGLRLRGTLTDLMGEPRNGLTTFNVRIYSAPTGGTPVYSEAFSVQLTAGALDVVLGVGQGTTTGDLTVGLTPPSGQPFERYVTLQIEPDTVELTPRRRLTAGAFALLAQDTQRLGGQPASSYVTGAQLSSQLAGYAQLGSSTPQVVSGQTTFGSAPRFAASGPPSARADHSAVWTGSRMLVWGGETASGLSNDGAMLTMIGGGNDVWDNFDEFTFLVPRKSHTAVWTGRHMIVFGGLGASGPLNDGASYDPATDRWTAISTMGAPSARSRHVAVWTGNRMLVWGGTSVSGDLNDGASYDPATDTWTPMSATGAPSARRAFAAVWTGSRWIVWGGSCASGDCDNADAAMYDPAANAWSPVAVAGAPSARHGHTMVWTGTRMIAWGGRSGAVLRNDGGRYDPVANAWATFPTANAPSPRTGHTAVWSGTCMFVFGGVGSGGPVVDGGRYNQAMDAWSAINSIGAPSARSRHTAVWTGQNFMVVWGGEGTTGLLDSGGLYLGPPDDVWAGLPTDASPPFSVSSSTQVQNLNADRLDGISSEQLARVDQANTFSALQTFNLGAQFASAIKVCSNTPLVTPDFFRLRIDRERDLDLDIVAHEFGHGLSWRVHGESLNPPTPSGAFFELQAEDGSVAGQNGGNIIARGGSPGAGAMAGGTFVRQNSAGSPNGAIFGVQNADGAMTHFQVAGNGQVSWSGTAQGAVSGTLTGTHSGDGSGLTGVAPADNSVTAAKLADNSVTGPKLAASAVTSGKIANGAVANAHISSGAAITDTKLDTIATAGKVADSALSVNIPRLNAVNRFDRSNYFTQIILTSLVSQVSLGSSSEAPTESVTFSFETIEIDYGTNRPGSSWDLKAGNGTGGNGSGGNMRLHAGKGQGGAPDGKVSVNTDLVVTGAVSAAAFSGNGSALAGLNAASLASGSVAPARGGLGIDTSGTVAGSILRTTTPGSWAVLAPGADGQVLKMSGGAPGWGTDNTGGGGGGGTVTSITAGTGIACSPDPIITSGTVSIDTTVVPRMNAANTFTAAQTIRGASPLILEGATVDANTTTVAVVDPTAPRTITLPDTSGTVLIASAAVANANPTPSVKGRTVLFLEGSLVPTTITDLLDGVDGQVVVIVAGNNPLPITLSDDNSLMPGNFRLRGNANWEAMLNHTLTLCRMAGVWFETSRSVN